MEYRATSLIVLRKSAVLDRPCQTEECTWLHRWTYLAFQWHSMNSVRVFVDSQTILFSVLTVGPLLTCQCTGRLSVHHHSFRISIGLMAVMFVRPLLSCLLLYCCPLSSCKCTGWLSDHLLACSSTVSPLLSCQCTGWPSAHYCVCWLSG